MKESIFSNEAPNPIGPYSQAIISNNILYISGQIALNKYNNKIINHDLKLETHQVMKNIQFILLSANMTFKNIVKTSLFIKNINDFNIINNIYSKYFNNTNPYPARETIEVSSLPKGVNIEISAIAHKF